MCINVEKPKNWTIRLFLLNKILIENEKSMFFKAILTLSPNISDRMRLPGSIFFISNRNKPYSSEEKRIEPGNLIRPEI